MIGPRGFQSRKEKEGKKRAWQEEITQGDPEAEDPKALKLTKEDLQKLRGEDEQEKDGGVGKEEGESGTKNGESTGEVPPAKAVGTETAAAGDVKKKKKKFDWMSESDEEISEDEEEEEEEEEEEDDDMELDEEEGAQPQNGAAAAAAAAGDDGSEGAKEEGEVAAETQEDPGEMEDERCVVFVTNLPWESSHEHIKAFFTETCGQVVQVVNDPDTPANSMRPNAQHAGRVFVEFRRFQGAQDALRFSDKPLMGRPIRVQSALKLDGRYIVKNQAPVGGGGRGFRG